MSELLMQREQGTMDPRVQINEAWGIRTRHQECPIGWTEVDEYHPHSCPWDCHGAKQWREMAYVLREAGIESVSLMTSRERMSPAGTGPGGRVRFGDSMMPGIYRTAVPAESADAAKAAIEAYKQAIHAWLHDGGQMPVACRL